MSGFRIESSWKEQLQSELTKDYMNNLRNYLSSELKNKRIIYPRPPEIFNAFNLTPFKRTKVVIIGQDPYHGPGQAHGLCFSVRPNVKPPPSLVNIYKEIKQDLKIEPPSHGHLEFWAKQGVLLLNSVLTVEHSKAGSHRGKGWETFTDRVVQILNEKKQGLVFILWGRDAQKKGAQIDRKKHLVLESAHPSPFSATKFFGNHHFSKANRYLIKQNEAPINWALPEIKDLPN